MLRSQVYDDLIGLQLAAVASLKALDLTHAGVQRGLAFPHPTLGAELGRVLDVLMEGAFVLDAVDLALGPAVLIGLGLFLEERLPPVLAQRMPVESLPHQDPARIGGSGEPD